MNQSRSDNNPKPDERFAPLINEYFDRRQAGEELTPESFIAEHPDLAEDLKPYLEGLSLLGDIGAAAEGSDPDAPVTDLPVITGYALLKELGRGGMGVVYKALQITTKRVVAVKVLLAGPFASPTTRHRFEREIELAARLQHPNIVRVLESGVIAHQQYYSMDYVEGIPLDRYVSTVEPDVAAILHMFLKICEAVEHAHEQGVIHRDLKPANVLVAEGGQPHVLDFGLAKAVEQAASEDARATGVSAAGQVMGTLPYLSPEQATGESDEVDRRTDVFSLGVMLFEALTGSLPFGNDNGPTDVIRRIVEQPPASPSSRSSRVDRELETIILRCLEKEKDRRFQSPKDLADDLHRYLEGEPILARRPTSLYYLRKKIRKHRIASAISLVLIAAAAVASVFIWDEYKAHREGLFAARRTALLNQNTLEVGAPERALGPAQALLSQYPQLPELHVLYAHAMWRTGRQEDAVISLETALQVDPSRWACRSLLAEIYNATGDAVRADDLMRRAESV